MVAIPRLLFWRIDQLFFGVTQKNTISANAQNFWYKPHRLEISGRMNLQVINLKRGRPAPPHEEINPQKSQNILELQAKETHTKGKKKKKPDKALNPLNPKNLKAKLKVVSEIIRQQVKSQRSTLVE